MDMSELEQSVKQEAMLLMAKNIAGGVAAAYIENGFPLFFISEQLLAWLHYTKEELDKDTNGKFINLIYEEDREEYLSKMKSVICNEKRYEFILRIKKKEKGLCWMCQTGTVMITENERKVMVFLCMDITEKLNNQRKVEEKERNLDEKSRELEILTANMPGGICEVVMDDSITLLHGNGGFYTLFEYTPEQMKEEQGNQVLNLIFERDRQKVIKIVTKEYLRGERGFEFECRVVCRNGNRLWILVRGNYSKNQGRILVSCVIIDITDRKNMEQELRINEERFRVALEQTDNTIFDYDIRAKTMIHGDKSADLYGLMKCTKNVPQSLVESKVVHQDSADAFLEMYDNICRGVHTASCTVKVRLITGRYVWRKISMTGIFDENGNSVRAVGILEDIDAQVRREEKLRFQSERDALTRLYNKGTTEVQIKHRLKNQKDNKIDALFIIDIDAFKGVNDQYGHLFGDFVLHESGRRISALFHHDDIIGRIGGDEFLVFMGRISEIKTAQERAKLICKVFTDPFSINGVMAKISCSIGVAFYPKDGIIFQELYQRADNALYEAKRKGKNGYVLFKPDMKKDGKWIPYSSTIIDGDS